MDGKVCVYTSSKLSCPYVEFSLKVNVIGSNVGFLNLFYFYCLTFWCDIKIFRCTIFSAIEGWIPFISSNLVCYIMNNDFSVSNIYSSYFFYFSIMPETFIEPHKVLSPLPKHLPALQMLKTKDLTKRLSDVSSLSASSSIGTGSSSSSDRIRYSTKFCLYFQ